MDEQKHEQKNQKSFWKETNGHIAASQFNLIVHRPGICLFILYDMFIHLFFR